ncbi:MAG TPA: type I-E CRISPR-associated protein Cas7/Cse4/CasC, partial [Mycobacteriales bacterium]|nr:type I-E CRISPR-associated protein Cas7/Cse4/CasC [Mycobacteriales bacterium]
ERSGRVKKAAEALLGEAKEIERAYGETPVAAWVTRVGSDTASLDGLGPSVALDELVGEVGELVGARLGAAA